MKRTLSSSVRSETEKTQDKSVAKGLTVQESILRNSYKRKYFQDKGMKSSRDCQNSKSSFHEKKKKNQKIQEKAVN